MAAVLGLLRRRSTVALVGAAIGMFLFSREFGVEIVLGGAAFWTNPKNDMLTNLVGYNAFLSAPWGIPPTVVWSLSRGPISIVYTDSLAWLSLALKASHLGHIFNPLGLFTSRLPPVHAHVAGCSS